VRTQDLMYIYRPITDAGVGLGGWMDAQPTRPARARLSDEVVMMTGPQVGSSAVHSTESSISSNVSPLTAALLYTGTYS